MLKKIRKRGILNVGVSLGFNGFSNCQDGTQWKGFDVDLAKAVAAGVLGDATLVQYVPLQSASRFTALNEGEIDIGTFNSSITLLREIKFGVNFVHPMLYDSEKLLTSKANIWKIGIDNSLDSLNDYTIGVIDGSTTEGNLMNYFDAHELNYRFVRYGSSQDALAGYENGECSIYCLDLYMLEAAKARLKNPNDHIILKNSIAMEVMSPVVLANELEWSRIVSWMMKSLIKAEELSVGKRNIDLLDEQLNWEAKRFLYPSEDLCNRLKLSKNFTKQIISQVGNYADIFDSNLGKTSGLNLSRNENQLWMHGGLLYSPPFQ